MLLSDIAKTTTPLNYPKRPKPKMGFSIDELVGKKDSNSPPPPRTDNPSPTIHNSSPPIDHSSPRISPVPEISKPRACLPYGRTEEFIDVPTFDGYSPNPYAAHSPSQGGMDYMSFARSRYPYIPGYEPLSQPHLQAPLPLMVNRDSQHLYPWLLNRHLRILPHKLQGDAAFLFHPFRKPKRIRTAFSPTQLLQLEHAFEKNHYVVGSERRELAQNLSLSETQVKVWFQNRRTKYKRQKQDGPEGEGKSKDYYDSRDSSSEDEGSSDEKSNCSPPISNVEHSASQSSCGSPPRVGKESLWSPVSMKDNIPFSHSVLPSQYNKC
ncbi:hypothetical protein JTE90_023647 [Oedothorax gibbosus]|uniref:Homeobox domain-containing protein n=1 Tax=Oedothorax gibbosus TaxID=931172 RepID=A0AAV6UZB7_9ARAC|nr:hypothetical protein JTE90_023647 [Oedothorax gibbosus]